MKYLLSILTLFVLVVLGCEKSISSYKPSNSVSKRAAYGKPNHLTVVADKQVWNGDIGDSIRYYFESPYMILPQQEPVLDVRHYSPSELSDGDIRRRGRNILVVANQRDEKSSTLKLVEESIGSERLRKASEDDDYNLIVVKNAWAKGQNVFFLLGNSSKEVMQNIKTNFGSILQIIQESDLELINNSVYQVKVDEKLSQMVEDKFKLSIDIPRDYVVAKELENFMWLRKDTRKVTYNLMVSSMPYRDTSQLSVEGLKSMRDTLGKAYFSSSVPGSYMLVNDVDLPIISSPVTVDGNYGIEAHGIWELNNDFVGGPFVSYLLYNPKTARLYLIDGFVLAPGEKKRNHMQYLEAILRTVKFVE